MLKFLPWYLEHGTQTWKTADDKNRLYVTVSFKILKQVNNSKYFSQFKIDYACIGHHFM